MKKISLGIIGRSGKMGQALLQVLAEDKGLVLAHSDEAPDVWIDFSNHSNLDQVISIVKKTKAPLVSGTTGYTEADFKKLKALAKLVPVMWSGNMSFGIHILLKMLNSLNSNDNFDMQVIETHHRNKKDAPSGTALMIQKEIDLLTKRNNQKGQRPRPLSVRGGGVFGEHEVRVLFDEEILEIKHTALNRLVFAKGAIKAAKAIVTLKPGYYTFGELLNFEKGKG